jgi:hypothetical protein
MELHSTQILLEKGQHHILSLIAEEKNSLSEVVPETIDHELQADHSPDRTRVLMQELFPIKGS